MDSKWLALGATFGGLAVVLGAFGAHALAKVLDENAKSTYEIAVRYQMYHAFLLIVIYLLSQQETSKILEIAGWSATIGIIVFSGSLYLLALTDVKIFGAITPLGGIGFILSWILVAFTGFKSM